MGDLALPGQVAVGPEELRAERGDVDHVFARDYPGHHYFGDGDLIQDALGSRSTGGVNPFAVQPMRRVEPRTDVCGSARERPMK
jgi:hypothetical protein